MRSTLSDSTFLRDVLLKYDGLALTRLPFFRRHKIMAIIIAVLVLFAIIVFLVFRVQVWQATQTLHAIPVKTIETSYGKMTYAEKGSGIPVLIAHGTDGGYDQCLTSAGAFGNGYLEKTE